MPEAQLRTNTFKGTHGASTTNRDKLPSVTLIYVSVCLSQSLRDRDPGSGRVPGTGADKTAAAAVCKLLCAEPFSVLRRCIRFASSIAVLSLSS